MSELDKKLEKILRIELQLAKAGQDEDVQVEFSIHEIKDTIVKEIEKYMPEPLEGPYRHQIANSLSPYTIFCVGCKINHPMILEEKYCKKPLKVHKKLQDKNNLYNQALEDCLSTIRGVLSENKNQKN